MGILLAFAPFFVYLVVVRLSAIPTALVAAAITSALLIARDAFLRRRSVKILELGTLLLFAGLAAYARVTHALWTIPAVRLRVDLGLLLIVLVSILLRKPFTLQYAREQVPQNLWSSPIFVATNYVITAVWAAAFAILVLLDLAMLRLPNIRPRLPIILTILTLYAAARFTAWYPTRNPTRQHIPTP